MGDVAQILGVTTASSSSRSTTKTPPPTFSATVAAKSTNGNSVRIGGGGNKPRLTGIQKEVMNLLGASTKELPPIMPTKRAPAEVSRNMGSTNSATSLNKQKLKMATIDKRLAKKWIWAPFQSSARSDNAQFNHWVKAGVEYPDYPYARFDVHLDPVVYNEDEYNRYLKIGVEPTWTKNDTDKLIDLARRYELRWPVIYDRFNAHADESSSAVLSTEELQHRYYSIATKLNQVRLELAAGVASQNNNAGLVAGAGSDSGIGSVAMNIVNKITPTAALGTGSSSVNFNVKHERERRRQSEAQWNRSKEEEKEEADLRMELKLIETQIRKLKKSGKHLLEAPSNAEDRNGNGIAGAGAFDKYFAQSMRGNGVPYLQSARLLSPSNTDSTVNKTLLKKMEMVIKELHIPDRPVPTKQCCDMFDTLRKDVLTMLTLQKIALKKEVEVESKKKKLKKAQPVSNSIATTKSGSGSSRSTSATASSSAGGGNSSTKKTLSSGQTKQKNSKSVKNSKSLEGMGGAPTKKSTKRKSVKRASSLDSKSGGPGAGGNGATSASDQNITANSTTADEAKPNKKRIRKSQ